MNKKIKNCVILIVVVILFILLFSFQSCVGSYGIEVSDTYPHRVGVTYYAPYYYLDVTPRHFYYDRYYYPMRGSFSRGIPHHRHGGRR